MSRRYTVAVSVCLNCQRNFGVALWPWSGASLTRTHGLCRPCGARLEAAFDDERPAERFPTVEAIPPAA
jgi:hypothetical protein